MNKTIKRILLVILAVFVVFFLSLLILPYAFRGKIVEFAKRELNTMVDAKVDFDKISLSFIRDFPKATVGINDVCISGVGEFEQDTLFFGKELAVVVNLKSIFSDKGYEVYEVRLDNAKLFAHVLEDGKANWDIMKDSGEPAEVVESPVEEETSGDIRLKLHNFSIRNTDISYVDEESKLQAFVQGLNHHTSGDLSLSESLLKTKTTIQAITLNMDGTNYISNAEIALDIDLEAALDDMRFSFSKNSSRINAIEFSFEGWLAVLEEGLDMDIRLITDDVDFKSILSMIPAVYMTDFTGLKADGDIDLSAYVKGQMMGENYPAFDVKLNVSKAWLQYPDLPKGLKDIQLLAQLKSSGGNVDNIVVDIPRFSFNLGGNPFEATLHLSRPISDPDFMVSANGKMDLGMIKDFYPLGDSTNLNGILALNLDANGKLSYYEKGQFDKFRFKGNLNINNMLVNLAAFPQDISIQHAELIFNDKYVDLPMFKINIGRNDMSLAGKLENFVAYVLHDQTIKGQLTLHSQYLNINDFMTESSSGQNSSSQGISQQKATGETDTPMSVIEIPRNIDFTVQAQFNELLYDKMHFTNAKGILKLADGELDIRNMGLNAFGGDMSLNGSYNTRQAGEPRVDMDVKINEVEFTRVFSEVGIMKKLAPVFEKASGKFSTNLSFNTLLESDMSPDLSSFSANGKLSTKSVGLSNMPVLSALSKSLNRPDLESVSIKNLNIPFKVSDGKLYTDPFDIQVQDVKMSLGGYSTLDQTLNYTGKVQLPDNLNLGRLSTIGLKIGGTFSTPKVSVDVQDAVSDIVDEVKNLLKDEFDKQAKETKEKLEAEVQKTREEALRTAREQADKIQSEARKAGEKLLEEARKQGDDLVKKASNPIAKKAAEAAAAQLVKEAQKAANELNRIAVEESEKLVKEAEKI